MLGYDYELHERDEGEDEQDNFNTYDTHGPVLSRPSVAQSALLISLVSAWPELAQYAATRGATTATGLEFEIDATSDQSLFSSKQISLDIDWDDVELELDATKIGDEIVLMPMADLKPDGKEFYTWNDFDIETLKQRFKEETGITIDTKDNIFVVVNELGQELMRFRRNGGYRVALKRFVTEYSYNTNMIRLQVEPQQLPQNLSSTTRQSIYGEQEDIAKAASRKRKDQ
ncbi:hypothetical protein LTR64_008349 [Lithohypha guttulata]|uniref:uncharacterized protein n=1 Tax=Lithohypha guttulata TaxID=1690604 RepID=UPI002DE13301|nr:hypothetical protein LTR51_008501 [Lithohypha guttulata]